MVNSNESLDDSEKHENISSKYLALISYEPHNFNVIDPNLSFTQEDLSSEYQHARKNNMSNISFADHLANQLEQLSEKKLMNLKNVLVANLWLILVLDQK